MKKVVLFIIFNLFYQGASAQKEKDMKKVVLFIIFNLFYQGASAQVNTPSGLADDKTLTISIQQLDPGYINGFLGLDPKFYLHVDVYNVGSQHFFAVNYKTIESINLGRAGEVISLDQTVEIPLKEINRAISRLGKPHLSEPGEYIETGLRIRLYHNRLFFDDYLDKRTFNFPTQEATRECSYCSFLVENFEENVEFREDEAAFQPFDDTRTNAGVKLMISID